MRGSWLTLCCLLTGYSPRGSPCEIPCDGDTYAWIVCEITSGRGFDGYEPDNGQYMYYRRDVSGRRSCTVAEGMRLEVRCENSTHVLYKNESSVQGNSVETAFAVLPDVEGTYECWSNGSVSSSRYVKVETRPQLVPKANFEIQAHKNCEIFPDNTTCCKAVRSYNEPKFKECAPCSEEFYVLGSRPISFAVDVVWITRNHYPVDRYLQWNLMADNTSTLHVVNISTTDLILVAEESEQNIDFFVSITASNSEGSANLCFITQLVEATRVTVNSSLPLSQTVGEGQAAEFNCIASDGKHSLSVFKTGLTVSLLVKRPFSESFMNCYSCELAYNLNSISCTPNDTGICHGLQFRKRVVGLRTLDVMATWNPTVAQDSGALVMCAIASYGITQWVNTATLTVLPTSSAINSSPTPSSPTPSSPPPSFPPLRKDDHLILASTTVLVVVCVGVFCVTIVIVYWIRWRKKRRMKRMDGKNLQQALLSQHSSVCSELSSTSEPAPQVTGGQELPMITVSQSRVATQLLRGSAGLRNSVDSGLECANSADDINALQVGRAPQLSSLTNERLSHSLNNLHLPLEPQTQELQKVCVYVSYSDSQQEWVQETLCPLLYSFASVEVTDHEGHMIAGNVISEERVRLIRSADKVVVVVSPDYQQVEWCCYELQHAVQQRPGAEGRLVPILCAGCRQLPSTIQTLHPILASDPAWKQKLRVAICRHHSSH